MKGGKSRVRKGTGGGMRERRLGEKRCWSRRCGGKRGIGRDL